MWRRFTWGGAAKTIITFGLVVALVWLATRAPATLERECEGCTPDGCIDTCNRACLTRVYDRIEATLNTTDERTTCTCTCSSTLAVLRERIIG